MPEPDGGAGAALKRVQVTTAASPQPRGAAYAWRWMRIDVPLRVVPACAIPLAWAIGWGGGPAAIGLAIPFRPHSWPWLALQAVAVAAGSVIFVALVLRWSARPTPAALALELPFFLVLNPVAEELLFRGLLQPRLATLIGFPAALAIVAAVFGFHHVLAGFKLPFLLWATLGGFLFGAVAQHYGSVVPAILLHSAADAGLFIIGPWVRAARQNRSRQNAAA